MTVEQENKYSELRSAGDYFKHVEDLFCGKKLLDPGSWAIVRLDGHGFSTWVKRNYPTTRANNWHPEFERSMTEAALAMARVYSPAAVYTFSDEVSLVFAPSSCNNLNGGRILKLSTLMASMMTAKFALASGKSDSSMATFDARAFSLKSKDLVARNIVWRMCDARRNSVGHWARQYGTDKELHGMSSNDMIEHVAANKEGAVLWIDLPTERKCGQLFIRTEEKVRISEQELAEETKLNPKYGSKLMEEVDPLTGERSWSYSRTKYESQQDVVETFCRQPPSLFFQLLEQTVNDIRDKL